MLEVGRSCLSLRLFGARHRDSLVVEGSHFLVLYQGERRDWDTQKVGVAHYIGKGEVEGVVHYIDTAEAVAKMVRLC